MIKNIGLIKWAHNDYLLQESLPVSTDSGSKGSVPKMWSVSISRVKTSAWLIPQSSILILIFLFKYVLFFSRDIFTAWVAARGGGSTYPVKWNPSVKFCIFACLPSLLTVLGLSRSAVHCWLYVYIRLCRSTRLRFLLLSCQQNLVMALTRIQRNRSRSIIHVEVWQWHFLVGGTVDVCLVGDTVTVRDYNSDQSLRVTVLGQGHCWSPGLQTVPGFDSGSFD